MVDAISELTPEDELDSSDGAADPANGDGAAGSNGDGGRRPRRRATAHSMAASRATSASANSLRKIGICSASTTPAKPC